MEKKVLENKVTKNRLTLLLRVNATEVLKFKQLFVYDCDILRKILPGLVFLFEVKLMRNKTRVTQDLFTERYFERFYRIVKHYYWKDNFKTRESSSAFEQWAISRLSFNSRSIC